MNEVQQEYADFTDEEQGLLDDVWDDMADFMLWKSANRTSNDTVKTLRKASECGANQEGGGGFTSVNEDPLEDE